MLCVSHTNGIIFCVTASNPSPLASVYLAVDTTGISTTNLNCTANLVASGTGTITGALSCGAIASSGNIRFGALAQTNTLQFYTTGSTTANTISVTNAGLMSLTANSTSFLKSDGSLLNFYVNNSGTVVSPLQIYSNGVVVAGQLGAVNKVLVLYDSSPSDAPASASNFFGFGVSGGAIRHNVPTTSNTHKFYTGATLAYTITNTGGANGSDARWKTEVQNITGALDKIVQLQGKTFILNDNPDRQMGFIAQEVMEVVPEVVFIDNSDENQWHFLQYDRMVALLCEGIKEQQVMISNLQTTVSNLQTAVSDLQARVTALGG
jgi:hypothetical protein